MAFVKLDKPTGEWVNLAHVVKVDVSGDEGARSVRVWLAVGGELVPAKVASGLSEGDAELEVRKLVEGAPHKPRAQRAKA